MGTDGTVKRRYTYDPAAGRLIETTLRYAKKPSSKKPATDKEPAKDKAGQEKETEGES